MLESPGPRHLHGRGSHRGSRSPLGALKWEGHLNDYFSDVFLTPHPHPHPAALQSVSTPGLAKRR